MAKGQLKEQQSIKSSKEEKEWPLSAVIQSYKVRNNLFLK